MADTAPLIEEQGVTHLPVPGGMAEGTNLLLPPTTTERRLAHFPPEVYDLSPGSHLYRFLSTLLGDTGVGQLRKRLVMARIQTTLHGTHFFDLDRFYGALLGIHRRVGERLNSDPSSATLTNQQWDGVHQRDASYRSRIEQFAKAVQFGASAIGMELIAEALLSVDCDVYESFMQADKERLTHEDLGAFTHEELTAFTHDDLGGNVYSENPQFNRWTFTVVPKRPITHEERIDLFRVLRVFKPAQALLRVQDITQSAFSEVPIRSASATSEHWEVIGRVTAREGREGGYVDIGTPVDPREQPRPAFSGYQGERWSHMGDVAGITGYAEEGDELVSSALADRVAFEDGTAITYEPRFGIRYIQESHIARLAADGIIVASPILREASGHYGDEQTRHAVEALLAGQDRSQVLRSIGHGMASPVYVEGTPIADLIEAVESAGANIRRIRETGQQFWATPPLPSSSPRRESLEVRFRAPVVANTVSFEVPHFPHRLKVQYFDRGSSAWVDIHSATVNDSMPSRLSIREEVARNRLHPQHSLNGHWIPVEVHFDPVEASTFRVQMIRLASGQAPVDRHGQPAAYSLGVKGLEIGYTINDRNDLPVTASDGDAIGTTIDSLGGRVTFMLREHEAINAVDGNTGTSWLSEPQPVGSAVVALYLDTRNAAGQGQVIDRFYLDPVRPGPLLNLYYSDQSITGHAKASDRPLTLAEVWPTGTYQRTDEGLALDSSDPSYFTIDNAYLQLQPQRDWSWALHFRPRYGSAGAVHAPLFSFDNYFAEVHQGELRFTTTFGDTVAAPIDFGAEASVRAVISYEAATQQISIDIRAGSERAHASYSVTQTTVSPIDTVTVGGSPDGTGVANLVLVGAVLKQGEIIDPEDFFAHSHSYFVKASYAQHDDGRTDNAILRFHSSFITETGTGFVGGPATFYDELTWTPVPRDFTLQKGYISLPPTRARFWKFEFSNLVIEPYEVFTPMQRVIRLFPASAMPPEVVLREDPSADLPAYETAANQSLTYQDTPRPSEAYGPQAILPTSALYAEEATGTQRLRDQAWSHGFVPWHVGASNPRFRERGVHNYVETRFLHTEKVAFFVGLKEIQAFRSDYGAKDNPEAIIERYWNADMLTPGSTFTLDPGHLDSGVRTFAEAESVIFRSRNSVSAVQFATQQSDAVQLIPDDQFRDPRLSLNEWNDDDGWHVVGDATLTYIQSEHAVRMSRRSEPLAGLDPYRGDIVDRPIHPVMATYSEANAAPGIEGGIESGLVRVSPEGVVHAAARVTAITDLTTPLWVQVVDLEGNVLTEEPITAKAGDTVEWTASYVLGSFNANYEPRFEKRTVVDHPVHPVLAGADPLVDLGPGPTRPGHLFRVRLVQRQGSDDTWKVDRLSLFDESIVWEFSVDGGTTYVPAHGVRNNPNGIVTMPRAGNHLRYRVRAYRRNLHISSLQIRPRYVDIPTLRLALTYRGPNVSAFDQYPPIQDDPEFKRWKHPVPRWWWLEGQRFGSLPIDGYTYTNEFSRGFIRQSESILPEITDTTTRSLNLFRHGVGNVPGGEELPVEDHADRVLDLARSTTSDTAFPEPDAAWANLLSDDRMPHPLSFPLPTADEPYIGDGDFEIPGSDENWEAD